MIKIIQWTLGISLILSGLYVLLFYAALSTIVDSVGLIGFGICVLLNIDVGDP